MTEAGGRLAGQHDPEECDALIVDCLPKRAEPRHDLAHPFAFSGNLDVIDLLGREAAARRDG